MLRELNSLTISHNKLSSANDIAHLADCKTLSVVDLSYNYLDDPEIVKVSYLIFTIVHTPYNNMIIFISSYYIMIL